MTDIEAKALALVNEVLVERHYPLWTMISREYPSAPTHEALCRALEQHEAFKQEVSDVLQEYIECFSPPASHRIDQFIIPKPKPDPLVEAIEKCAAQLHLTSEDAANALRAALDNFGFEIREKGQ